MKTIKKPKPTDMQVGILIFKQIGNFIFRANKNKINRRNENITQHTGKNVILKIWESITRLERHT